LVQPHLHTRRLIRVGINRCPATGVESIACCAGIGKRETLK
jgi:hypothetical protein